MWPSMESFPFIGRKGKSQLESQEAAAPGSPRLQVSKGRNPPPSLKVTLERKVYRPGDMLVVTIEITNEAHGRIGMLRDPIADAVLMEDLSVEVRGIEKLDPQWLVTPKPPAGSKQRRGERTILKSPSATVSSDVLIAHGSSRTYMVRTMLPKVLPPTYRGTAVRYLYYITTTMQWSRTVVENGHAPTPAATPGPERVVQNLWRFLTDVQSWRSSILLKFLLSESSAIFHEEVRTALPIWTLPHTNGLMPDESHYGPSGIVPPYTLEVDIQWKEKGNDLNWAWASEDNGTNGDERVSTPKSDAGSTFTSPAKSISIEPFERSFSVTSLRALTPNVDPSFSTPTSTRDSLSTSIAELTVTPGSVRQFGSNLDSGLAQKRTGSFESTTSEGFHSTINGYHMNGLDSSYGSRVEEDAVPDSPHSPAVVYNRGRSYNIRMDDEVLVRFSPKNPTSTYFFGDMVAGTLQFFHEGSSRRCLEVTAVLETQEVLNPAAVHPSRRNSSTITKVHSEYYEIVCDVINTHFLFSIPLDGPASITTPLLSLEWILRFEFVATPANVDWSKIEHPMLINLNERRKGEWSMPLTVHTTPPKKPLPEAEKPVRNSWARSPRAIYKSLFEEYPEGGVAETSASGSTPSGL